MLQRRRQLCARRCDKKAQPSCISPQKHNFGKANGAKTIERAYAGPLAHLEREGIAERAGARAVPVREVPGEGVLRGGGAGGVESKRQAFRHEDHSQIEDQRGEPAAEQTHSGHPRALLPHAHR